jgi:hypothetical protein
MDTVRSAATSVNLYQITRRQNPEDCAVHSYRYKELKPNIAIVSCFLPRTE